MAPATAARPRRRTTAPGAAAPRAPRSTPKTTGRLAAIDIGSNSIHMIVVEPLPGGGYRVLDREREMVRLGKSALGGGELSERAMRDGVVALTKMSTLARLKGAERTVAVATSAVREAGNGEEFLARVRAQTGLEPRRLSGEEEGRLIYLAVREAVDLGAGASVIVDVGGGSTEWITSRSGRFGRVVSVPLGSLRCAGWLSGDPPPAGKIEKYRRRLRKALARIRPPQSVARLVATSGTAVCCADLVDFLAGADWKSSAGVLREVRARDLVELCDHLALLRKKQIAALPPVGGPRSDSIFAGAVLLHELVRHAGVDRFQVSDRALREGVVLDALGAPPASAGAPSDVRRRQVTKLAERGPSVQAHGEETARLAARLFDLTQSLHGMGPREREWLEHAALLHDLGYMVDYEGHHKHGFYLVTNAALDAFDQREIEIIAHVVRYHRGAGPKRKHASFAALKPWQQRTVTRLSALLRVADALDRSHAKRVEEIYCAIREKSVRLEVISRYDIALELSTVKDRAGLFEQVFDRKLRARQGLERVRR
jgi:exopolyphosphatase/guanosine-5'-triphosphate,3'-diphosphate pyrophosphatase